MDRRAGMTNGCKVVKVGLGSCGLAAGAQTVYKAFVDKLSGLGLDIEVKPTGCIGMCYKEPLVEVSLAEGQRFFYGNVTPEKVERIVQEHILKGQPITEWLALADGMAVGEESFLEKQKRIVLRNCGIVNPESIDDYLAVGGYKALEKALLTMTPEAVITEITDSGLRGRGGAGFPTGTKWSLARKAAGTQKYLICNADEGDPGAFMDRSVLESDPHSVLEGMIIGSYAVGASEGYIYIRAEYPLAVRRLQQAIVQAQERGFIGENILGSGFDFHVTIREGAGAFVCGEETALIMSVEGKRGMPRFRPPSQPSPACGVSRRA